MPPDIPTPIPTAGSYDGVGVGVEAKETDFLHKRFVNKTETPEELIRKRQEEKRLALNERTKEADKIIIEEIVNPNPTLTHIDESDSPRGMPLTAFNISVSEKSTRSTKSTKSIKSTKSTTIQFPTIVDDPIHFAEKCVTAIQGNLKTLSDIDRESVTVLTIVPDGFNAVTVVYSLRITLNNIKALMSIISDAVERGHFKAVFTDGTGNY